MSEAVVQDDLQRVGEYVRANLSGWLREVDGTTLIGPQLLERMVRIEERLARNEHELKGLVERIAKELAAQREFMEARFDAVDKRFDDVNHRFDDVNHRFGDVNHRFEDVNRRFEDMNRRFNGMQWLIGAGFGLIAVLTSLYQLLG